MHTFPKFHSAFFPHFCALPLFKGGKVCFYKHNLASKTLLITAVWARAAASAKVGIVTAVAVACAILSIICVAA